MNQTGLVWLPLKSTSGRHIEAAYGEGQLYLKFVDKEREAVYQYENVPPEVHAALLAAPSGGAYLHAHIKGKYPSHVVSGGTTHTSKGTL